MVIRFGHFAFIFALLTTLISCSSDAIIDDSSAADKEQVQITFTINMGSSTTRANTTWGDSYDSKEATDDENVIEYGKLQIFMFSTDGNTLYGELSNLSFVRESSNIYQVVGEVLVDKSNITDNKLSCKIVALANCDKLIGVTSISDISSASFTCSGNETYIPMCGVQTYTDINLVAGLRTTVADMIYMLRAMAKVRLTIGTAEVTDVSITVSGYNASGYVAPANFATAEDTRALDLDACKNVYSSQATDALSLRETTDKYDDIETTTEKTFYYVYLPETASGNGAYLIVNYTKDNTSGTKEIYLGEYTKGKFSNTYFDLVRNHVYTYTLNENFEVESTLQYQAVDWDNKWAVVGFE